MGLEVDCIQILRVCACVCVCVSVFVKLFTICLVFFFKRGHIWVPPYRFSPCWGKVNQLFILEALLKFVHPVHQLLVEFEEAYDHDHVSHGILGKG